METSQIDQRFQPELQNPILLEGLPGFGNVGKIAAQLACKTTEAKLFAEYYSPLFPDYVTVDDEGVCYPPRFTFYAASPKSRLNTIILTGDAQPSLDNVVAYYDVCEEILDYVQKLGCKLIVTVGGLPISGEKRKVYVAATSEELVLKVMDKGGIIYGGGRIMGATGLLLGLGKKRGINGVCLLGSTDGLGPDREAGATVFKLLMEVFGKHAAPEGAPNGKKVNTQK